MGRLGKKIKLLSLCENVSFVFPKKSDVAGSKILISHLFLSVFSRAGEKFMAPFGDEALLNRERNCQDLSRTSIGSRKYLHTKLQRYETTKKRKLALEALAEFSNKAKRHVDS